jgi:hypothetical protein
MGSDSHSTPAAQPGRTFNNRMGGRECYHCDQWVEEGEAHNCWTTTEAALTDDLTEDLREAWERLCETAVEFGDQRIDASGTPIMLPDQLAARKAKPSRRAKPQSKCR